MLSIAFNLKGQGHLKFLNIGAVNNAPRSAFSLCQIVLLIRRMHRHRIQVCQYLFTYPYRLHFSPVL